MKKLIIKLSTCHTAVETHIALAQALQPARCVQLWLSCDTGAECTWCFFCIASTYDIGQLLHPHLEKLNEAKQNYITKIKTGSQAEKIYTILKEIPGL